ncbi:MAG: molybdopterin-guanine dinucleotide biosynthesis protein B [Betaproteobacteria bacterium]|jgi:molybdopterin-guanine dinucleotide biosynthesis protein B|nr:MAG: molybdopterin-guanine dinucleotide biosynthesis protein B [Betaproteobacteria bacterium]
MKVFGFAGYSGSGKTTLIERVIPLLVRRGLRVSLIKHAHHAFDVDQPGKDSYRHRRAGATEVMLTSAKRWVLMHEIGDQPEPELPEQLRRMSVCDIVLVEGFKKQPMPKLEIHRKAHGAPFLFADDPRIVGIATDEPIQTNLPQFALNDYESIAEFVMANAAQMELAS